jgi:hypothetical protein
MIRRFFRAMGVSSLLTAVIGVPGTAEAADRTFRVPFAFSVNGKSLPPGTYRVSTADSVLSVRGDEGAVLVLTNTLAPRQAAQGQLLFHKHGREYFLRQAWLGRSSGRLLLPAVQERERIRTARGSKAAADFEEVTLPAL